MDRETQLEHGASILAEIRGKRRRQIVEHGYTAEHDDEYVHGELALAAIAYAAPSPVRVVNELANGETFMDPWPWKEQFDKRPRDGNVIVPPVARSSLLRRDLLVTAAAFIIAEIERIDRKAVRDMEQA